MILIKGFSNIKIYRDPEYLFHKWHLLCRKRKALDKILDNTYISIMTNIIGQQSTNYKDNSGNYLSAVRQYPFVLVIFIKSCCAQHLSSLRSNYNCFRNLTSAITITLLKSSKN